MYQRKELHKYQLKAINFIKAKGRAALFLDMGLGKTAITLTAVSDMLDDFQVAKVLIIAPLRVANTVWKQEVAKWQHLQHLDVGICTGSSKDRLQTLANNHDITVINRECIPWLITNSKYKWDFDCIIIDESTSFKNPSSMRFKALKRVIKLVDSVVLLTGTPSPQGYIDLWSQMYLLDYGERLGRTKTAFLNRFYRKSNYNTMYSQYELMPGMDKVIQHKIGDVCLTMQSEDYLELPERVYLNVPVSLPETCREMYKELQRQLLVELESGETITTPNAAGLNNKLLQMCNGAVYTTDGEYTVIHDEKIEALKELLEDNPNENILVAYHFKSDKERLLQAFPFAVELDKKGTAVDDWNAGKIRLLLAHPQSAGHGLNLQRGGSVVVYFGLSWSLETYQQFNKRLHRQGQSATVRIIHLVVTGGLDEAVLSALDKKEVVQSDLIKFLKNNA